jgi:hypothetical protein
MMLIPPLISSTANLVWSMRSSRYDTRALCSTSATPRRILSISGLPSSTMISGRPSLPV